MSARAQREMLKRNTYREEHGLPTTTAPWQGDRDQGRQHQPMQSVDSGYGSSSKGEDYDESKMYSLDIQRSSGQRPVRPSRPGDYRSDSSHESIPGLESAYGAQHPQHQPYMYSGNAEHGQTQPLAKRISQRINKRLSVASFLGEPAPLTQADEKRLEEERMLKAEEERKLDEEEKEMLKRGLFNWSELKSWRFWIRKEWWSTCTLLKKPLCCGQELLTRPLPGCFFRRMVYHPRSMRSRRCSFHYLPRSNCEVAHSLCSEAERVSRNKYPYREHRRSLVQPDSQTTRRMGHPNRSHFRRVISSPLWRRSRLPLVRSRLGPVDRVRHRVRRDFPRRGELGLSSSKNLSKLMRPLAHRWAISSCSNTPFVDMLPNLSAKTSTMRSWRMSSVREDLKSVSWCSSNAPHYA
jgi:hypothetical protein